MVNKKLKKGVIAVVIKQLKSDEPKMARITFLRLLRAGYSKNQAIGKMSTVLMEEMYVVMRKNEQFNVARYCANLKDLK